MMSKTQLENTIEILKGFRGHHGERIDCQGLMVKAAGDFLSGDHWDEARTYKEIAQRQHWISQSAWRKVDRLREMRNDLHVMLGDLIEYLDMMDTQFNSDPISEILLKEAKRVYDETPTNYEPR
jgi:hypothetical protein